MAESASVDGDKQFTRSKQAEKKELPISPYGFDETMARVMRVKPEPKAKKRKP